MDHSNVYSLIISGGVSILTIFGVRIVDFLTKGREEMSRYQGKEFDDGVERRKELIREIDNQRETIKLREQAIEAHLVRIESLKDQLTQSAIKYIVLENKYNDVVEALSQFSADIAAKFKI